MTALTFDPPDVWHSQETGDGGSVLLGFGTVSVHLVAPPGARIRCDEADGARASWRYAVWEEDPELGPPAISVDDPHRLVELGTAEVVAMLPAVQHDFVRAQMAGQIARAEAFARPPGSERLDDRQAMLAGRTRSWARAELASAFPDEDWFELVEPEVCIPGTVDELLVRLSTGADAARPRRRGFILARIRSWLGSTRVGVENGAFTGLAAALRLVGRRWGRGRDLAVRCDRRALNERLVASRDRPGAIR